MELDDQIKEVDDRIKELKLKKSGDISSKEKDKISHELRSLLLKSSSLHFNRATSGLGSDIKETFKDELTDDKVKGFLNGVVDLFKMKVNSKAEEFKSIIEHDLNLLKEQQRIEIRDVNVKSKDIIESMKSRYIAEADLLFADASLTETRTGLLKKIVSELKTDNITLEQYALLIKIIDPKSNLDIDIVGGKKIVEAQLERMKTENKKAQFEADIIESQSKISKATAEKSINDLNTVRDSVKRK
jgi:hypothetical protein